MKGKPLKVERVKISSLSLDPNNARQHSERSITSIAASLLRFGQQKPIVVSEDGVVIAGNGVLQAAESLDWSHIAVVRTRLTGQGLVAYGLTDNLTAEMSEWDLRALIQWTNNSNEDVPGWPKEEILALANFAGSDEQPAVSEEPILVDPQHKTAMACEVVCPKCSYEYVIYE